MRRKLADMDDEINGNNQISEEIKQKYEMIYEKEKKLEKFMKNFQNLRSSEMSEITEKQEQVMQYLENIS